MSWTDVMSLITTVIWVVLALLALHALRKWVAARIDRSLERSYAKYVAELDAKAAASLSAEELRSAEQAAVEEAEKITAPRSES